MRQLLGLSVIGTGAQNFTTLDECENIITYASFPITENSPSDISNAISFQMADEEDGEDGVKWWLLIPLVVALGFGAYFLIRA